MVTLRPFNTYGPRQSTRAVIPTIITQALVQDRVYLGALTPCRDLTYVDDIVDGFLKAAETDKAVGQTINIGSNREISVGDLAHKIVRLLGRDVKIVVEEQRLRPGRSEVYRLWADNRKARELLGWLPRISLDEGLLKTIHWIAGHLDRYRPGEYQV